MMNFTLITALIICSISWISVSVSESHTVEVLPGQQVTLMSSKMSENPSMTTWFRLVNRTKASCISSMFSSHVSYCDGFQNGKFEMRFNTSTVSLSIRTVNLSDSGLYFCGFYKKGQTVFSVIHLNVEDTDEPNDDLDRKYQSKKSVILAGLTGFLIMVIIGLAVKIRKLQKAASEERKSHQSENQSSDDLSYAAVTFCREARRREVEPNVVYSATR